MKTLILLIPILPFIGFLVNGLGRKHLSKTAVGLIGSGTVLGAFIISIVVFFRLDELSGTQISETVRVLGDPVFHYFDFINPSAVVRCVRSVGILNFSRGRKTIETGCDSVPGRFRSLISID